MKRADSLGIDIVRRGISDKKEALSRIQNKLRINKFETPFLVDDFNDLVV